MIDVRTFDDDWQEYSAESFREVVITNRQGDSIHIQEIAGRLMLKESECRFARRTPSGEGMVPSGY